MQADGQTNTTKLTVTFRGFRKTRNNDVKYQLHRVLQNFLGVLCNTHNKDGHLCKQHVSTPHHTARWDVFDSAGVTAVVMSALYYVGNGNQNVNTTVAQ